MSDAEQAFLHLARLSLEGKTTDSLALVRQTVRSIMKSRPDLAHQAEELLQKTKGGASIARSAQAEPIPVDIDSRLELVRREMPVNLEIDPVWPDDVKKSLEAVIAERQSETKLLRAGLTPTRSILLIGSPGVGKTLSARWLAMKLNRPLLVLDLAAVMSSYLGKTGNNIRSVLSFAQKTPSVLLLDEFDAIAKRRDDIGEIGELKRLVTVLLQAVDDWPADGLLLAATNHPELLDPAIWRRFDRIVEFPKPSEGEQEKYISNIVQFKDIDTRYLPILSKLFEGLSFSDIEKRLNSILREMVIANRSIAECLDAYISSAFNGLDKERKLAFARLLAQTGYSQREIHDMTGYSRDTLREHGIGTKDSGKKQKDKK